MKGQEESKEEQTVKAKKARKPFVWTEKRKESFDKMKLKREEKMACKLKLKSDLKNSEMEDRKNLNRLIRIKTEMTKILNALNDKHTDIQEGLPEKAESPPKIVDTPKKVVIKPVVEPEPEPEPCESDMEEEVEEYVPPVQQPKPKPTNQFRYSTQTSGYAIPKPAQPTRQLPPPQLSTSKPKNNLVFL
jgi:hypothetical protein